MRRRKALGVLAAFAGMAPEARRRALARLPVAAQAALAEEWWWGALDGQIEPAAGADGLPWRVWAIVAGRGFGKTRAGAEWVWARARENPGARIALVAASREEAARVMVEGESGLLAVARRAEAPRWISSRGLFVFPSGAQAFAFSADRPATLRGPQHHFAWCDELAKWPRGEAAWDNLMLGLRLGERPRTVVTTTPQPIPLLKRILASPRCVTGRGGTDDNPHIAADFRETVRGLYGGTRLGRQELEGVLLEDVEGALWTRQMIEDARSEPGSRAWQGLIRRTVVGVDPPASAKGDCCGIVVCGLGGDGIAYVLADHSVSGQRPEGWARRVAAAASAWDAQKVVAEKNQGGEMVESVLVAADCSLPVRLVAATRGKAARAEPVALRFETGRAKLAGVFPELEDELCGLTFAGYCGPGRSPDRADAMVWAMSELLEAPRAEPRITLL
jgi:phage terminase large subunit-like protein